MKISPIHFRAHRHFPLHHGNKQQSIQMHHFYIDVLVTAAPLSWISFNLQVQVSQLLGPGLCFLLASKSGFSHRVNPYTLHMLKRFFFAIPHQLVQVNSWDIPNDSFRMRLIISYHIWSVYAPFFSCLEQISNWDILKSTEFHCQATGRKRGQGRSCDDAFGISICPVLGVFGGVFCPPWKLSGFCLFLVVSTLGMESPSHSWAQGPTEPIVLNQDFPEASTSRCNRPQHAWREVFPV
jgi:hypothetical protein